MTASEQAMAALALVAFGIAACAVVWGMDRQKKLDEQENEIFRLVRAGDVLDDEVKKHMAEAARNQEEANDDWDRAELLIEVRDKLAARVRELEGHLSGMERGAKETIARMNAATDERDEARSLAETLNKSLDYWADQYYRLLDKIRELTVAAGEDSDE